MALTQSTTRHGSSSKFNHVSNQFSKAPYLRKDNMERSQRIVRKNEDEVDELMSSDDGKRSSKPGSRTATATSTTVPEERPKTPPSIPTPPWLASPLPKLSASEREYTSIRSTSDAPDDNSAATPVSFARYTSSAQDMLATQREYDSATVLGMADAPPSRFRSMSPPEMEPDREMDDEKNGTPETPNPGTAMQTLGPLTCTTLSPHDAMTLRCQLGHDPHRLNVLGNILKSMTDLMMPNHDMVWNLLVVTEGGYNCPFPQCARHRDGWSRADRTRAHIYADHLLIRYKCDKCNSYFKREQDFNIHVASHDKQPAFECTLCSKSFPKKFNLNRHLRQIHDQKPVTKVRQSG